MSRRALALAVRDQLRATALDGGLALAARECELAPIGGQPPPRCGERFVGIYVGGRTNTPPNYGLDEVYTVHVVVTFRAGRVPFDQLGPGLMEKLSSGFDAFVDAVRLVVAKDFYTGKIKARANTTIGYDENDTATPRGFSCGLQFLGDDDPQPVGPSWFLGTEESGDDEDGSAECGIVQRLRFGGARRVQSWEGTVT